MAGVANVADSEEIKVTPEMIEAGVKAYCVPWMRDDDDGDVVTAIYRAMETAKGLRP
jgi:hypothetical protein